MWHQEFGAYGSLFLRGKRAVDAVTRWTHEHAPPVAASLLPGATERAVDDLAANLQLPPLAPSLRLLWRLCAGQALAFDAAAEGAAFHESALHGLFAGYAVYDHVVSTRLMPLPAVVMNTRLARTHAIIPATSPLVLVAASFDLGKIFFVNATTGDVHVMLRTRELHPAAPPAADGGRDAVLSWLEHYAARLASGAHAYDAASPTLPHCISGFPRTAPQLSVSVTNGVRVEVSAVWMPESSDRTRDAFGYRCVASACCRQGVL